MKKICVIGNSHIASLKLGWDTLKPAFPGIELTFFGARARALDGLAVRGDALVAGDKELAKALEVTSGGLSRIAAADYDVFLVYGLDFILPRLGAHLSEAVRRACLQDVHAGSLNGKVCAQLRQVTGLPVFVGHNPQLADGSSAEDSLAYEALFATPCRVGAARDMAVVCQPAATLAGGWSTRREFAEGSVRLDIGKGGADVKHPQGEVKHMNARFGEVYLREFLSALA